MNSRKLIRTSLLLCSALLGALTTNGAASIAAADEAPNSPVVIIDMQRVLAESIAGKAARNNLETEAKKRKSAVEGIARDVQKMRDDFQKQGSLLSGAALDEKREALEKRTKDYERAMQDVQEALERKNNTEVEKIVKQVDKLLDDLAKERKYSFILERDLRFVIYSTPEMDLTPEVIKRLDALKLDL